MIIPGYVYFILFFFLLSFLYTRYYDIMVHMLGNVLHPVGYVKQRITFIT